MRRFWKSPSVAALVAGALALAGAAGCGSTSAAPSGPGAARLAITTLKGVPQSGLDLGRPGAPARVTVFADLTDGRYAQFAGEMLPDLLARYVRSGRLSLRLRPIATDATYSQYAATAARTAQAASEQNRGWQFADVFAAEYLAYLDPPTLNRMLRTVPGLDVQAVLAAANAPSTIKALDTWQQQRHLVGAKDSLSYVLANGAGRTVAVLPGSVSTEELERAIQGVLVGAPKTSPPVNAPAPAPAPTPQPAKPAPAPKPKPAPAKPQPKPKPAPAKPQPQPKPAPKPRTGPRVPARPPVATPLPTALFAGIPQDGFSLGYPKFTPRLAVFADLTRPQYATFARTILPRIVTRNVRTGRALMQLRTIVPGGSADALRVAHTVQAVGLQDHLWQFAQALATAGPRVSAAELARVMRSVPNVDASRALADAGLARIQRSVRSSLRRARQLGVSGSFGVVILPPVGHARLIDVPLSSPDRFVTAVDSALCPRVWGLWLGCLGTTG